MPIPAGLPLPPFQRKYILFFKNRLTVLNDTAAWDVNGDRDPGSCVDLDPIELYETCPVVVDPLESAS